MRGRGIVIDALQVPREFSGVGRQVLMIGAQLRDLPGELALEVRCPADVRPLLEPLFPPLTRFRTPIRRSRPRLPRILYQQVIGPLRDSRSTVLVCLGDQGPVWGPASTLVVVNDVRRLTHPATSGVFEHTYYRSLVPRAVRRAAAVVTISEFSRDEIERELPVSRPVQVVAHHPPPRVATPGGRADGYFLTVGALRPYKGVETAMDALALVPPTERRELLFAGPPEGRVGGLMEHARARGVADWVHFLGWVDESELRRLYERSLATINPSTYEGYGLPVAESLSYALPTVASDIPPHREIGGDAVLYFGVGRAPELAESMRRLSASESLRRRLAWKALERSQELSRLGPSWRDLILGVALQRADSP